MTLEPLLSRIVIRHIDASEPANNKTGFTDYTTKVKAEVIATGLGGVMDGLPTVMRLKKGDKVIVSKSAGTEIILEGQSYMIIDQDDIFAVVRD